MALLIPPFLANAFERMGAGNKSLEQVVINTKETAASVSVGGDLYKKMDELVKALKGGTGKGGGKVSIKEALVLRITAGALEPIGLGLGVIIDALERAPEGKELKLKMEALTNGLLALGDIGWSILKFAGLMILALPLLIIAGVAMLLIVPLLKLMVDGLMWATKKLDKKGLANIAALGDVGKSLLILTASLVLMALLAPLALQGLLVAGVILLGFGLLLMLLQKMKLDSKAIILFGKSLQSLALGLFFLSLTLVLIGLLAEPILVGLGTAMLVILGIAGVFWLMDKMQVDKSIRKTGIALMFAAGAILSLAIAIVLSHLILSGIGFEQVAKVMLIVGGVALLFGLIAKKVGDIRKAAIGLILAAGAILALTIAIYLMNLILPNMSGEDIINTFIVLAVIAGVAFVFYMAGKKASEIQKGAISMIVAAGAMIALAIGVWAMKKALEGVSWEKMLMMAAVITGVGLAFGIAGEGSNAGYIALGSAAMMAAGLALYILGGGVKEFQAGLKGVTWENLGMMGAIIVGVGAAFALAGIPIVAGFIALGAAAMIVAGAALIVMGKGVAEFNKLPIQDMMGSGRLFGDSGQVTKGFMGFGGGRKMTNMEVMFLAIADSFSLGPLQIAAMYAGAPALEKAGWALQSIGKGLQEFQKIVKTTDLKELGVNVGLITTTLIDAFAKAGNLLPRPTTIMGALLNAVSDQNPVSKGISSVAGMGNALTSIAMGFQQMANLRFPVAWDKNGKPIKFESMKSDAPAKVAANTATIVDALVKVFADAGDKLPRPTTILGALLNAVSDQHPVTKGISAVSGMGGALMGIAMGFQSMANLRFPTKWDKNGKPIQFTTVDNIAATSVKVNENIRTIITGLTATFSAIGAGDSSSWWESSDYEKGVSIANNLGTPLKNLSEGVTMMANLKFPTGFDKNGKPTGFIDLSKMKPEDIKQRIGTNTQLLIEALTDTFVAIGGGKAKESSWWQGSTTFEKGVSVVNSLTKPYNALTETVKSVLGFIDKAIDTEKLKTIVKGLFEAVVAVGELDGTKFWFGNGRMKAAGETYDDFSGNIKSAIPTIMKVDAKKFKEQITALLAAFTTAGGSADPAVLNAAKLLTAAIGTTYEKMGNSIPGIVGATNKFNPYMGQMVSRLLFGQVDAGNAVAGYNAQHKMQLALATTYGKAGENFPKISSSINALDLTKLTESRKMFEALAVLSKGGSPGDILAQMGSSLEDALKNLANMLEKFKTTVKEGNDANGGILESVGKAVTGVKNAITGGGGTKPDAKETPATFPSKFTVDISAASITALKGTSIMGGGKGP